HSPNSLHKAGFLPASGQLTTSLRSGTRPGSKRELAVAAFALSLCRSGWALTSPLDIGQGRYDWITARLEPCECRYIRVCHAIGNTREFNFGTRTIRFAPSSKCILLMVS